MSPALNASSYNLCTSSGVRAVILFLPLVFCEQFFAALVTAVLAVEFGHAPGWSLALPGVCRRFQNSEVLFFFSSPAVHGWESCYKASEPDSSGFVSRLSLRHTGSPMNRACNSIYPLPSRERLG